MARIFNNGKPYHGSDAVMGGKLRGATDTDYFNFFCPVCQGSYMVRLLDFEVILIEPGNIYNEEMKSTANRSFSIAFKFHCEQCGHTDFFKISNIGWQGGNFEDIPYLKNKRK